MNNRQVVKMWDSGYCAVTEHLFTNGKVIWSYGKHYPIAARFNGNIYFNTEGYSQTTAVHTGHVARVLGYANTKELVKAVKNNVQNNICLTNTTQLQALIATSRLD